MDERLVFGKTPKGTAEVAARSAALSLAARRILIMVDGRRSVGDLTPLLKPGELEPVLLHLESLGLVTRVSEPERQTVMGSPLEVNTQQPINDTMERIVLTLDEAKRRAVRELVDRLGPDAETLSLRMERCKTPDELRERIRDAEKMIAALLSPTAAQDYLRALRRPR